MSEIAPSNFRMNSKQGKEILAMIRGKDFAHPGEREAVEMVFQNTPPDSNRKLLDIGCGLGGTADLVTKMGLGQVTAVDIDEDTIHYAVEKYPDVDFVCCDAEGIVDSLSNCKSYFDVLYMFNSLHAMLEKQEVLTQLAQVAASASKLLVFDYSVLSTNHIAKQFIKEFSGSFWQPIEIDQVVSLFESAGWKIYEQDDITGKYQRWYEKFLENVQNKEEEIVCFANQAWYDYVFEKYTSIFQAVTNEVVSGIFIKAEKIN